jgi:hypothetical protein
MRWLRSEKGLATLDCGGRNGTIAQWTETPECRNNKLDSCSVFQVLDCSCSDHPVRIGILVCTRTSDLVAKDRIEDDRKWFSLSSLSMEQSGRIRHDQFWRFDLVAIPLGDFSVTCPDVARNSMVAAFKGVIYAAARANRCRTRTRLERRRDPPNGQVNR